MISRKDVEKIHLNLANSRGLDTTYCPSEVARKLDSNNWRELMDVVREVADDLVAQNILVIMQGGKVITMKASDANGPIRLRLKD